MKKKTRIVIGTLGFFLPVLLILIEFMIRFALPAFKLPALFTPVVLLGPLVLFGLAIFSSGEMKILSRIGLFAGTFVLYAVQIYLVGAFLIIFTGLEGTR